MCSVKLYRIPDFQILLFKIKSINKHKGYTGIYNLKRRPYMAFVWDKHLSPN